MLDTIIIIPAHNGMIGIGIQHNGYVYQPYPDGRTVFHIAKTPDGQEIEADFRGNKYMTQEDFSIWVELGCPSAKDLGCNNWFEREHLMEAARTVRIAAE